MNNVRQSVTRFLRVAMLAAAVAGCATGVGRGFVFQDCELCPELVVVPAGRFDMGGAGGEEGRPEGPVRAIQVASFAMGRFEISNAHFQSFVRATRYRVESGCHRQQDVLAADANLSWLDPGFDRRPAPNEPVVCINWHDAQAYVTWLSALTGRRYRLPTEAEWEYIARQDASAGSDWSEDSTALCPLANVLDASGRAAGQFPWPSANCDDGFPGTAPVGSFPAGSFGIHDIGGNVSEWAEDCYQAPYPPGPLDGGAVLGGADCEFRSVRGGGWATGPSRLHPSFRGRDRADARYPFLGFRVVRELY
jgi:formylglycine-generating enzyme required for sulfatase activity